MGNYQMDCHYQMGQLAEPHYRFKAHPKHSHLLFVALMHIQSETVLFEITINNTQSQIQVSNLPTSTVSISGRTFYDLNLQYWSNISYSFDAYTSDNAQITYTITNEISYGGNISNHNHNYH